MSKRTLFLVVLLLIICITPIYAQEKDNKLESIKITKEAETYWSYGRFDKSLECAELAVELDPQNIEAYKIMLRFYGFKGPISKEIEVLNKIILIKPDDFEAYYRLYVAYSRTDDYSTAVKYWNKAIEINPQYTFAYKRMVIHYAFVEKDYAKALAMLETVIALEPDNPEHYVEKSSYLMKAGNYTEALESAKKALSMDKQFSPSYVQMAQIYYDLDIFSEESLIYLDEAIKLDEKLEEYDRHRSSDVFFGKYLLQGKLLLKLGRKEEAKIAFENVAKNSTLMFQIEEARKELELLK